MATPKKLGTLRGAVEWEKLETAADVRRFMAWCIHSIRNQDIEPKTAAIMAQIGCFLLKAVEVADLDSRLALIEKRLMAAHAPTPETVEEKVIVHAGE